MRIVEIERTFAMTAAVALADTKKLLTFEEFAALDPERPAELVEGRIVEKSRNNPSHAHLVTELGAELRNHIKPNQLGSVFSGDVSVITKHDPDSGRGADIAFVSNERLADQPEDASALQVAPELIIEVISPSNSWDYVMEKAKEYFDIGVKQVWIASPALKTIQVYTSIEEVRGYGLSKRSEIDANDVIPGLKLDLNEVFA